MRPRPPPIDMRMAISCKRAEGARQSSHKTRPRGTYNEVKARHVVGDVEGRHCVLIDDMIDTAGTICAAAELLAEAGASDISAMATHAVLSDPAVDRLKAAPISRVVVTDTLPVAEDRHLRQARGALGGQDHRRRHRRRVRGHLGLRALRRGQPGLDAGLRQAVGWAVSSGAPVVHPSAARLRW